jgi:hypothetical protein
MSIVPQKLSAKLRQDYFDSNRFDLLLDGVAAWAFEQAATLCDENGRSDGHTCAKEIRAMIGGQENGA